MYVGTDVLVGDPLGKLEITGQVTLTFIYNYNISVHVSKISVPTVCVVI